MNCNITSVERFVTQIFSAQLMLYFLGKHFATERSARKLKLNFVEPIFKAQYFPLLKLFQSTIINNKIFLYLQSNIVTFFQKLVRQSKMLFMLSLQPSMFCFASSKTFLRAAVFFAVKRIESASFSSSWVQLSTVTAISVKSKQVGRKLTNCVQIFES